MTCYNRSCQRNFNLHHFWNFKVYHSLSQLKFSDGALERSRKEPLATVTELGWTYSYLSFVPPDLSIKR